MRTLSSRIVPVWDPVLKTQFYHVQPIKNTRKIIATTGDIYEALEIARIIDSQLELPLEVARD